MSLRIIDSSNPSFAEVAQLGLAAQGFYQGKIDGRFGPMSIAALEAYEQLNRYAGISRLAPCPTEAQAWDLKQLVKAWQERYAVYHEIAVRADVPPELVAALHKRECDSKSDRYLHNGDHLGWPTINVPAGINFPNTPQGFLDAAVDALTVNAKPARTASGITFATTELTRLCTFAEYFNGLGYLKRGLPSPYVLAGTTGYTSGKFTSDHGYDASVVDTQLGVLLMFWAIRALPEPATTIA